MWIGESYDSEKYVGYVREDSYFLESFNGLTLAELAARAPDSREVEGVSGATMTSQAVFQGLVAAASDRATATGGPTDRTRLAS